MKRRAFLARTGIGALGWTLVGGISRGEPPPRTNVLFIIVDDLRPELGCYGRTRARTPNLDRLAAEGVLFERAYCQQAVCAPSRASVLSGCRPDTLGIYDLKTPLRSVRKDVITMPQAFRQAGYETVTIGKIYHHHDDDAASWCRMPKAEGGPYAAPANLEWVRGRAEDARKKGLAGQAAIDHARGPATECAEAGDDAYADGGIAAAAVRQLGELHDRPFFLAVGFLKPHLPFCAPKRYWDMFDEAKIELPDERRPDGESPFALVNFGELRKYSDMPRGTIPLTAAQKSRLIHGYLAATAFMDAQVGKVLDELARLKLADRTVVVLWGDHGWKLGEYASWCKHSTVEYDTRIPLLVRAPGLARGGRAAGIVEAVDLFPTLAELCGVKAPATCEGRSLVPQVRDPAAPGKPCAVSQYPRGTVMGYSLRTDRWRYTEWHDLKGGRVVSRELYDQSAGDFVNVRENLAGRPEQDELVRTLSAQLKPFVRPAKKRVPANEPEIAPERELGMS